MLQLPFDGWNQRLNECHIARNQSQAKAGKTSCLVCTYVRDSHTSSVRGLHTHLRCAYAGTRTHLLLHLLLRYGAYNITEHECQVVLKRPQDTV